MNKKAVFIGICIVLVSVYYAMPRPMQPAKADINKTVIAESGGYNSTLDPIFRHGE